MKRRVRFGVFFVLLCLFTCSLGLISANAAAPQIAPELIYYKVPAIISHNLILRGIKKTSAVTKLKSSNPKVATATAKKIDGQVYICIAPKKPGETTVSFHVKYKGKTRKLKTQVTILKYASPFAQLKIGSTDLTSWMKKDTYISVRKPVSGKLTVKLKKGWKIIGIETYKRGDHSNTYKEVRNNKKIKLKKGYNLQISVNDGKDHYMGFTISVD